MDSWHCHPWRHPLALLGQPVRLAEVHGRPPLPAFQDVIHLPHLVGDADSGDEEPHDDDATTTMATATMKVFNLLKVLDQEVRKRAREAPYLRSIGDPGRKRSPVCSTSGRWTLWRLWRSY